MTVGELKDVLEGLDDDMFVVTAEYNSGYGGLFDAGCGVFKTVDRSGEGGYEEHYEGNDGFKVLAIGPRFG